MTLLVGTVADAVARGRRLRFDEGHYHGLADYLFERREEPLGPQALIARQAPGWVLPTHFHMQHQFQVILRGSGTLGKHALVPGGVHYTSPQSAYGPIVAGEDGLDYFTLRALTDTGAWYLPEARPHMSAGMFKEQQWGDAAAERDASGWRTLIPLREDGLGAWAWTGAPEGEFTCLHAASEAGRFHAVIRGSFAMDATTLDEGSCVYWSPPGNSLKFRALVPDAMLVVAQFPTQAVQHHVPPELRVAPSPRGSTTHPSGGAPDPQN